MRSKEEIFGEPNWKAAKYKSKEAVLKLFPFMLKEKPKKKRGRPRKNARKTI